jgi:uncharacterized membrane protein YkoI
LLAAFGWTGQADDKEVKVKMRDLPEAARKTVQEQSKSAALKGLTKEVEDGKTYYEAELKVRGHGKDVLIDPSGAVVEVEEEVPMSALPAAARESLQKSIAGGKLLKLESISKNNTITAYEAAVKKSGQTSEIKVTPDGKPVEK